MLDINLIRENPELVKENIKKKFQDEKIPLVDEVIELDIKFRQTKTKADELRAERNRSSKEIGLLMREKKKEEAEAIKERIVLINEEIQELEEAEAKLSEEIKDRMMVIPNIIDDSVPIGRDDSENVEVERLRTIEKPFEVPHHIDIMERLNGIDLESAQNQWCRFYYLMGDMQFLNNSAICKRFYD